MPFPAVAPFLPALAKSLGEALPFLALGLFGKKKDERLTEEEKALLRLRAQLGQLTLGRQQQLEPLFRAMAQGIFGGLPAFAKKGQRLNLDVPNEETPDLRALMERRFPGQ